jgi:DNA-binding beta-propeller fold protein YncE
MKRTVANLFAFVLLVALSPRPVAAQQTLGVYVANQGNFADNNGSITFYDPASGETTEVLGDAGTIFQGVQSFGGHVYAVANTGGRIDILDAATNMRLPSINGLANPRYLAFVDETKAYLTNQVFRFGGVTDKSFVSVIDLATGAVTDTLQVPGQPDHIALAGGRAYVALGFFAETSLVAVIDTATDALIDVIDVACAAPRYLVVDDDAEVHVVCNGLFDFGTGTVTTPGAVVMLDGATGAVVGRIEMTTLLAPNASNIAAGQDAAYSSIHQQAFLIAEGDILILDTATNTLVDTLTVAGSDLVSGVAYDDASDRLYLARHDGSFTTQGRVEVYAPGATTPAASFDAAVAPVHIAFLQEGLDTALEQTDAAVPEQIALHQNYPNPFNPTTRLPFDVAQAGPVTLAVYDAMGRRVAVLVEATMAPGRYEATWQADRLASGVYVARLAMAGRVSTRRLVLLK